MNRLDEQTKKEFVLATGKDVNAFAGELQKADAAKAKELLLQHKEALVQLEKYRADRKSTRLNSSHITRSRMPSSA